MILKYCKQTIEYLLLLNKGHNRIVKDNLFCYLYNVNQYNYIILCLDYLWSLDFLLLRKSFWVLPVNTIKVRIKNRTLVMMSATRVAPWLSLGSRTWFSASRSMSAKTAVPFGGGQGCWTMISWCWTWKRHKFS